MLGALVHGGQLIVADDIAALHIVALLSALVGDMAEEEDAVAGAGVEHRVFLGLAPFFELRAVEGVEVGRRGLVAGFG